MTICDGCGTENSATDQFCADPRCRRYLGWQPNITPDGASRGVTSALVDVERRDPVEATLPLTGEIVDPAPTVSEASYQLVRQRPVAIKVAPPTEPPAPPAQGPHLVTDSDQGLILSLDVDRIEVQPGREAVVRADVHNKGSIVDSVDLAVQGVPREWITFRPPTVNLFVDAKASLQIRVAPPVHSTTRPGPLSAVVAVWSATNPKVRCSQRLDITVAPFADLDVSVQTPSRTARRRATFAMSLTNRGNSTVHASIAGADQEGMVVVRCQPATVAVEPGGQATVMVVASVMPIVKGSVVRHKLTTTVSTGQHSRQIPVTLVQPPLLSKGMARLLVAALALALVGVALAWHHLRASRTVTVPNVVGMSQQMASQTLRNHHLNPQVVPLTGSTGAAGTVSNENPPGGAHQAKGSTIVINVPPGPAPSQSGNH